jgi:hypothetical protein
MGLNIAVALAGWAIWRKASAEGDTFKEAMGLIAMGAGLYGIGTELPSRKSNNATGKLNKAV